VHPEYAKNRQPDWTRNNISERAGNPTTRVGTGALARPCGPGVSSRQPLQTFVISNRASPVRNPLSHRAPQLTWGQPPSAVHAARLYRAAASPRFGKGTAARPAVPWKSGASAPRKAQKSMWASAPEDYRSPTPTGTAALGCPAAQSFRDARGPSPSNENNLWGR
jgi:hypothetical protein